MVPFTPPKSPTHLQKQILSLRLTHSYFHKSGESWDAVEFPDEGRARERGTEIKTSEKGQKRLSASFTLFPSHGLFSRSARRRFHVS